MLDNETTFDVKVYNLRHEALDVIEEIDKIKHPTMIYFAISLVVLFLALLRPIIWFFDKELLIVSIILFLLVFLLSYIVFCVIGIIKYKHGFSYVKLLFLSRKLKNSISEVDEIHEKQSHNEAYDKDVEKAEDRLINICERIIEISNKY